MTVAGVIDQSTPPDETRTMVAAVTGRGERWLVPRGDHAAICELTNPAYRSHLSRFLASTIGPPA